MTCQNSAQGFGKEFFEEMAATNVYFGMDIGTKADDLAARRDFLLQAIGTLDDQTQQKVKSFLYFSAGIWPDPESIRDRFHQMEVLENSIKDFTAKGMSFCDRLVAIGEGGIDHHWNPSGADGRCESDFDQQMYLAEKELFHMQLDLAKRLNKPYIVHSRDAFQDTLEVLKAADSHSGIIHCYSYGIEEARQFLDLGYYISFSGSQTYAKKSKLQDTIDLIRFIPDDRLLLETDSPYLAPVPMRGKANNPTLVKHTYEFVAQHRVMEVQGLCDLVDRNCRSLFAIP